MRDNFSLSSQKLSDELLSCYEDLVYLLGVEYTATHYSGLYEYLDASGAALLLSPSGIPIDNGRLSDGAMACITG